MTELQPPKCMESWKRGHLAGLRQAADWLDVEADRWIQDSLKTRIKQLANDIRATASIADTMVNR